MSKTVLVILAGILAVVTSTALGMDTDWRNILFASAWALFGAAAEWGIAEKRSGQ